MTAVQTVMLIDLAIHAGDHNLAHDAYLDYLPSAFVTDRWVARCRRLWAMLDEAGIGRDHHRWARERRRGR